MNVDENFIPPQRPTHTPGTKNGTSYLLSSFIHLSVYRLCQRLPRKFFIVLLVKESQTPQFETKISSHSSCLSSPTILNIRFNIELGLTLIGSVLVTMAMHSGIILIIDFRNPCLYFRSKSCKKPFSVILRTLFMVEYSVIF